MTLARCDLNRERDPVDPVQERSQRRHLLGPKRKAGLDAPRVFHEEGGRRGLRDGCRVRRTPIGQGQGGQGHAALHPQIQRLAAGYEDFELRTGRHKGRHAGRRRHQVLEIVEDEQEFPRAEIGHDSFGKRVPPTLVKLQEARNGGVELGRFVEECPVHKPRAVRKLRFDAPGGGQGQARLPDSSRPGQRHQLDRRFEEERPDGLELVLPVYQGRRVRQNRRR
jgi:hypothetical protein